MRLVISTNYYDWCNSWDTESYIEYESVEKFYVDFCNWCETECDKNSSHEGFLGLGLFPVHIKGNEQHSTIEIYTYEEWWDKKFVDIKGE